MIHILLRRLGGILLIIALQVFVFNHINLWGYATPLLGFMVLLYTPLNASRTGSMFLGFLAGIVLDAFSNTPGVSAGAITATAFVQHPLINVMAPKDAIETAIPDMKLLGRYTYLLYLAILMAVHHIVYFLFEAFTFHNFGDLALRLLCSYAISMLMASAVEMLCSSKK